MQMTVDEIEVEYRQSRDKKQQLQILADENCCGVQDIINLLIDEKGYTNKHFGFLKRKTEKPKAKKSVTVSKTVSKADKLPELDWRTALEVVSRKISELTEQEQSAKKELAEIVEALGNVGR